MVWRLGSAVRPSASDPVRVLRASWGRRHGEATRGVEGAQHGTWQQPRSHIPILRRMDPSGVGCGGMPLCDGPGYYDRDIATTMKVMLYDIMLYHESDAIRSGVRYRPLAQFDCDAIFRGITCWPTLTRWRERARK